MNHWRTRLATLTSLAVIILAATAWTAEAADSTRRLRFVGPGGSPVQEGQLVVRDSNGKLLYRVGPDASGAFLVGADALGELSLSFVGETEELGSYETVLADELFSADGELLIELPGVHAKRDFLDLLGRHRAELEALDADLKVDLGAPVEREPEETEGLRRDRDSRLRLRTETLEPVEEELEGLEKSDDAGRDGVEEPQLSDEELDAMSELLGRLDRNRRAAEPRSVAKSGPAPPPPSNDDCAGATPIGLSGGGACSSIAFSMVDSTGDGDFGCDSAGTNTGVWFSFVAPPSGDIEIEVSDSGEIAILEGSCAGTEVYCSFVSSTATEFVSGLTAGTTYYMIFWEDGTPLDEDYILTIREDVAIPGPPANDACSGAIALSVGAGACVDTSFTMAGATDDGSFGCDASANYGVWFSFVAPGSGTVEIVPMNTAEIAVFEGSCAGPEVYCNLISDGIVETVAGLTPGVTYYMAHWEDSSSASTLEDCYSLCLRAGAGAAPNDDCSGALNLPVGPDGSCPGGAVTFNYTGATGDGDFSCDSAGTNYGVWFEFVAPPSGSVRFETNNTVESAVFDACGGTEVDCNGSDTDWIFSGLTPGATYYLVLWEDTLPSGSIDYEVCASEPPAPPANDDCGGAAPLDIGTVACADNVFNMALATPDGDFGCDSAGTNTGVWFEFVAPASGVLELDVNNSGEIAILEGACGGTEVYCEFISNGSTEIISCLEPGMTYYMVFWEDGTPSTADYNLCARAGETPSAPNDECAGAIPLGMSGFPDTALGDTSLASISCADVDPCVSSSRSSADVWYSVVGNGCPMLASTCGYEGPDFISDTIINVYSGSCMGALDCAGGDDDGCDDPTLQSVAIWDTVPGETYYIRVQAWGTGVVGTFELTVDQLASCDPPANDACEDAESIARDTVVAGTVAFAELDPLADDNDGCGPEILQGGVWYRVAGTGTEMTASTSLPATGFDTQIHVFCENCDEPTCVAGDDDSGSSTTGGNASVVSWCSQLGANYLLFVSGDDDPNPFQGGADFELLVTASDQLCFDAVRCIPEGACCNCLKDEDYHCTEATAALCDVFGSEYKGDFTTCDQEQGGSFVDYADDTVLLVLDSPGLPTDSFIFVPDDLLVSTLEVSVDLDMTESDEVEFRLRSPSGTEIVLYGGVTYTACGDANDGMTVTFRDDAGPMSDICDTADTNDPIVGSAAPAQSGGQALSTFAGEPAMGAWTLIVDDESTAGTNGLHLGWSLRIIDVRPAIIDTCGKANNGGGNGPDLQPPGDPKPNDIVGDGDGGE